MIDHDMIMFYDRPKTIKTSCKSGYLLSFFMLFQLYVQHAKKGYFSGFFICLKVSKVTVSN